MKNTIEKILGYEVMGLTASEMLETIKEDVKIVENSAVYNQDETISIETLENGFLYVTNEEGEVQGYYKAK